MYIVFVLDGIFRPESEIEQSMCIVFVLDGKFRPENKNNAITTTIVVYCICIERNIPAGKLIQHNNKCVLYVYWTEYSGR